MYRERNSESSWCTDLSHIQAAESWSVIVFMCMWVSVKLHNTGVQGSCTTRSKKGQMAAESGLCWCNWLIEALLDSACIEKETVSPAGVKTCHTSKQPRAGQWLFSCEYVSKCIKLHHTGVQGSRTTLSKKGQIGCRIRFVQMQLHGWYEVLFGSCIEREPASPAGVKTRHTSKQPRAGQWCSVLCVCDYNLLCRCKMSQCCSQEELLCDFSFHSSFMSFVTNLH